LVPLQPLPQINSDEDAVAAAARLKAMEDAFRAAEEPTERRSLARGIILLRVALTDYRTTSSGRITSRPQPLVDECLPLPEGDGGSPSGTCRE
jgi:hypothetical protein